MPRLPVFALLLAAAGPAWPADELCPGRGPLPELIIPENANIEVTADNAEVSPEGESVFRGNVRVERGPQVLETQDARYDPATGKVTVDSGVRFSQPGFEVEADTLDYEPATGQARLGGGRFLVPQTGARGSAAQIRTRSDERLDLDDVTYTTCPGDEPDWLLEINELRMDTGDSVGEAEDVKLEFLGVPVIYWPYLSFPLSDDRKSGFLIPEFGQSQRSGVEVSLPYYFNLAPNRDYLLTPVYLHKRGLQLKNELRYLTDIHRGTVELEYLNSDDARPDSGQRSYFNLQHLSRFESGVRLVAGIEEVSDTDYFQDLGAGVTSTSQTYLERNILAEYTGPYWRILARAQNFRTLDLSIPEDQRPYARLPQVGATGFWRNGFLGADWRLQTEATVFSRDVGNEGTRLLFSPGVSYPLEGPGYFVIPSASVRYVEYHLSELGPEERAARNLAAPVLSVDTGLIFERPARQGEFVQTLEPRLLYAYIPFREQDDLPLFDTGRPDFNYVQMFRANRFLGADRIGDTNQISLGVTSRLLDNASGREFLTASIGKAWYLEPQEVFLPGEPVINQDSSPIVTELGLGLFRSWNADMGFQWDNDDQDTRLAQFRVQYRPARNRVANLSYRYRPGLLEDLGVSVGWPISSRWSFAGNLEYSLRDKATVNRLIGFQYESCCFAVRLGTSEHVSRRDGTTDTSYWLQLEFKGLAGIGSSARSRFESDILGYNVYE
ncbi:MAG: LPS assembly protein LptD [Gammaproteobacteria bacterium]